MSVTKLWVLRHGDAEEPGLGPDAERELTELGRDEARAAGAALAALSVKPDIVLASPRVRAQQTALLATAELDTGFETHLPLSGGFGAQDALSVLAGRAGQTVVLVGHMPDLAIVVRDLSGANVALRTGGLALLRGSGAAFELAVLLRPRESRAIIGEDASQTT